VIHRLWLIARDRIAWFPILAALAAIAGVVLTVLGASALGIVLVGLGVVLAILALRE